MTKDELLGIFRTCENNCKLVYAAMVLFSYDDTYDYFSALYKKLDIQKPLSPAETLEGNGCW